MRADIVEVGLALVAGVVFGALLNDHVAMRQVESACLYDNAVSLNDREFVCVLKRPIQPAPKMHKQSAPRVTA